VEVFSAAILNPGVTPTVQFRFRHKDGSWRFIEAIGNNLIDPLGAVQVVINSRDVTAHKLAERAQQEEAEVSSALAHIGRELMTSLDRPALLERLCQVTAEVLRGDCSHTLLYDSDEDIYVAASSYGYTCEESEWIRLVKAPRAMLAAR